ncbi:transketolase [Candidatus Nanosynbacter lyticus]|uniref:Transketolase n=1 Tax=Candidatus Nanosynbacter lyticus TaxID=2093824 RepID=A0A6S4GT40_9BACT|nr:transketolase [Candidatus Nanosynbacter lyticus]AJA06534.1 transketolase [Candidatus Nanosynbacter lyticus]QCT41617.1 transketolase [TM7 phylum sp. oral taxon 952]
MSDDQLNELREISQTLRQSIIHELVTAGSGHAAGCLGFADVMAVLYFYAMRLDPENPDWQDRDIFVMSNGHYAPLLYATLAERGFFDKKELVNLRKFGSKLQGHPERGSLPGIETTSGPLGCGLSQAAGMAYSLKYLGGNPQRFVYCSLGDGELNEGNIWEAAMFAAKYELSNIIAIIDRNNIQIGGDTEKVMPLGNLADKWRSFGWFTQEVDGHDYEAIVKAIDVAKTSHQPNVIIAHTIPGFGVDFMEYDYQWHGRAPNAEEARRALIQLGEKGDVK